MLHAKRRPVSVKNDLRPALVCLGTPTGQCRVAGEKFETLAQLQLGARLTLLVLT